MSLFGSALGSAVGGALGGVGVAAGQVADDYLKRDAAMDLQTQAAQIQQARDQFVNDLKMRSDAAASAGAIQAHKDIAAFDNSPDQVAALANKTSAITSAEAAAKNANATYRLNPGETVTDASGNEVAANDNDTMVDIYKQGLRGAGSGGAGADAREAAKEKAAQVLAAQKELATRLQQKNYVGADGTSPDTPGYTFALQFAPKLVEHGASPAEAEGLSNAMIAKANEIATSLSTKPGTLWGDNAGSTDQVAAAAKIRAQVFTNMLGGMPEDKLRDPATYDPTKKSSAATAPSSASLPPAKSLFYRALDALPRMNDDAIARQQAIERAAQAARNSATNADYDPGNAPL